MTLSEKQRKFANMVGAFLQYLYANGYEVTLGEAKRSNEQAYINSLGPTGRAELGRVLRSNPKFFDLDRLLNDNTGSGISRSLHEISLAIDLNLFKNGVYLTKTEDYREIGEHWESLGGTWGGRFRDGNHFSLEHDGRK